MLYKKGSKVKQQQSLYNFNWIMDNNNGSDVQRKDTCDNFHAYLQSNTSTPPNITSEPYEKKVSISLLNNKDNKITLNETMMQETCLRCLKQKSKKDKPYLCRKCWKLTKHEDKEEGGIKKRTTTNKVDNDNATKVLDENQKHLMRSARIAMSLNKFEEKISEKLSGMEAVPKKENDKVKSKLTRDAVNRNQDIHIDVEDAQIHLYRKKLNKKEKMIAELRKQKSILIDAMKKRDGQLKEANKEITCLKKELHKCKEVGEKNKELCEQVNTLQGHVEKLFNQNNLLLREKENTAKHLKLTKGFI